MHTFIRQLQQRVRRAYEYCPSNENRLALFYAIDPRAQAWRRELRTLVSGLPQTKQKELVGRLAARNFMHAYHELVVGRMLKSCGLKVEYEPDFGHLRPDWYVHATRRHPAFLVEVFTPTSARAYPVSPSYGTLPQTSYLPDISLVHAKIERKVEKYKGLGLPLVICMVPLAETGLTLDDCTLVLYSKQSPRMLYTTAAPSLQGIEPAERSGGLFSQKAEMSAAIWTWRTPSGRWEMAVSQNAHALRPLPNEVFGRSHTLQVA